MAYSNQEKSWTTRGRVTEADKAVIREITAHNLIASRIFLTGEVHQDYIGQPAAMLLSSINGVLDGSMEGFEGDTHDEALFQETAQGTIRMSRFEPHAVWTCFHPDILQRLISAEENRIGIKVQLDEFDFYQALVLSLKSKYGEYIFPVSEGYSDPANINNSIYLGAILLYGKPGYLTVPVSEHFAIPRNIEFLRTAKFRILSEYEQKTVRGLEKKHKVVHGLTNPEINFLFCLYRMMKETTSSFGQLNLKAKEEL
jgi:hypothetical protein